MSFSRRNFIKTTSATLAITVLNGKLFGETTLLEAGGSERLKSFGLQLYTLRDVLPQDPKGVLKQVAAMGYKKIEGYEGDKGIFWGMKNTEFKKYLDDLGMHLVSTHCDINKDFERKAEEAAAIGVKYLICPSLPDEGKMSKDDYKKAADLFNKKGQVCKSKGLRFAFHNHDQAFTKRPSGFIAEEVLLSHTDHSLVDFEMDLYWVVTGGQDPISWLKKYPNRFTLCHIKDRKKNTPIIEREESVDVGTGSLDFHKILRAAKNSGMQYYIVEQEKYGTSTSLESARVDAEYLKRLRF